MTATFDLLDFLKIIIPSLVLGIRLMIVLIIYIQRNKKSKPATQPDQEKVEVPEKQTKPQALFNVTEQYKAIAHDEIDLNVGDLVNVSKVFGDGWGRLMGRTLKKEKMWMRRRMRRRLRLFEVFLENNWFFLLINNKLSMGNFVLYGHAKKHIVKFTQSAFRAFPPFRATQQTLKHPEKHLRTQLYKY